MCVKRPWLLKCGRQICRHLLIHPNLPLIIAPQPCRKRSVTLDGWPPVRPPPTPPLLAHFMADPLPGAVWEEIPAALAGFVLRWGRSFRPHLRQPERSACEGGRARTRGGDWMMPVSAPGSRRYTNVSSWRDAAESVWCLPRCLAESKGAFLSDEKPPCLWAQCRNRACVKTAVHRFVCVCKSILLGISSNVQNSENGQVSSNSLLFSDFMKCHSFPGEDRPH